MEANHPAVESFHDKNSFALVDQALSELNDTPVDWLQGAPAEEMGASATAAAGVEGGDTSAAAAAAPAGTLLFLVCMFVLM